MKFQPRYPKGATPLDKNELSGLIPDYITFQSELDILEQENIFQGLKWALKFKKEVLTDSFSKELHKSLFKDVWTWAGTYRKSEKSIGITPTLIPEQMHLLFKNVQTWIEFESYNWDEIAARFHHKLVFIHPFPNGNGRYSRIHTEILMKKHKKEIPTWGFKKAEDSRNLASDSELRNLYLKSLRDADQGRIKPLIQFLYS